jgi:hypothetical protein
MAGTTHLVGRSTCPMLMTIGLLIPVAANSQQPPRYELIPELTIGGTSGDLELGPVTDLALRYDGVLAIAQPQTSRVVIVSAEGRRLRTVGGVDSGMFRTISHVGWLSDTLWVADQGHQRITLIPPGDVPFAVRDYAWLRQPGVHTSAPVLSTAGLAFYMREADGAAGDIEMMVAGSAGATQSLNVTIGRPKHVRFDLPGGATLTAGNQPLVQQPLFALPPGGTHVTIVRMDAPATGGRHSYSVTRLRLAGDTIFRVERDYMPMRVTSLTEERIIAAFMSMHVLRQRLPSDRETRTLIESVLEMPDTHPPVSAIAVAADGATWLRGPDDRSGTVQWDVLDQSGRMVHSVVTDRVLSSLTSGNRFVWAAGLDEHNAPRVTRYRFERIR